MTPQVQQALQAVQQYMANRQMDQSLRILVRALQRDPRDPDLLIWMGLVLFENRQDADARPYYERAIQAAPHRSDLRSHYGRYLVEQGEAEEAEKQYREGIRCNPQDLDVQLWLGHLLFGLHRHEEAFEIGTGILGVDPSHIGALSLCGTSERERGRIDEGLRFLERGLALEPSHPVLISNYLYMTHNSPTLSAAQVFRAHQQLAPRLVAASSPLELRNDVDPERRLALGFVGGEFLSHSVMWFLLPLLRNLDRSQFQIFLYHNSSKEDHVTEQYRNLADQLKNIFGWSVQSVVNQIIKDRVDILIDLSGHTGNTRLEVFGWPLAPMRMTYLGYPDTTGLPLDYRMVDERTDPPGYESFSTENLLRLSGSFLSYGVPENAPPVQPLPALSSETFTFGSFNAMPKLNAEVLQIWGQLLARSPNYRLVLKNFAFRNPRTCEAVRESLIRAGALDSQIQFLYWTETMEDHWKLYHGIDLALDPFPYNGTTTTCEALMMGVPSVGWRGDRHCARVTWSLQEAVGLSNFSSETREGLIEVAESWVQRKDELAQIRMGLREQLRRSPVGDSVRFAQTFSEAIREKWRDWCVSQA